MDENIETDEQVTNDEKVSGLLETYTVGDLTLSVLARDHNIPPELNYLPDLSTLSEKIAQMVEDSDGGLFEYLPVELEENRGKFAEITGKTAEIDERLAYFGPFAEEFNKQGKDVYCADPAYNWEWFAADMLTSAVPTLAAAAITSASGISAVNSAKEGDEKGMTRRKLLSLSALTAAGALIGRSGISVLAKSQEFVTDKPTTNPLAHPAIRRAVVARALKQMGSSEEFKGKKLLMLIPPVHWEGIKQLLENEELLERNFKAGTVLQEGPWAGRLNNIRHYKPQGNSFTLQKRIPIK